MRFANGFTRLATAIAMTLAGGAAATVLVHATPAFAASVSVYASPTGSGTACSSTSPCTLTQAQTSVRAMTAAMTSDIDVVMAGGTYALSSAIALSPADSGQNGHRVVWQAAAGQTPVISGGIPITGWTKVDATKNIYRASVPVGTASRELFVNGARAQRTRSARNPGGFSVTSTGFTTSDPSYASWTESNNVEVVGNNAWKQMRCPLSSITPAASGGSDLTVDPACWKNNHTSVPNPSFPFNGAGLPSLGSISWIENSYQLLGTPGQFYLDSSKGALYYVPRPGENLATADVELPVTQELLDLSGTPGHLAPLNDTAPLATYTGSWNYQSGRRFGDLGGDVHYTSTNGDSFSYTFTGTGIQVLSETNYDEGNADVYVDGNKVSTVSGYSAQRLAQQAMVSVTGLVKGQHTVRVVKTGGSYLLIDGFTVIPDVIAPVHDISFSGITFAYTTWNTPSSQGYIDNQAGVLWDPVTHAPIRIPSAVQVHRGARISFTGDVVQHTGTSGIDLADQTQDSSVTSSSITDTSGTGVSIGEADDYYQTQLALMTSGNTVSDSFVRQPGQEYQDAVGIWVGHGRGTTLSHNDVGYTPYSGISIGWGWGWTSDCTLQAKQGRTDCLHGTTYSGDNHIVGNHVHSVMGALFDGGPIYTQDGQVLSSELSGNVLSECIDGCNMLYHDEGSSLWDSHDNVLRFGNGSYWVNLWTPTIHDDSIHDNYSDTASYNNSGTNITFTQATVVTNGAWPAAAQSIIAAAGPATTPGNVADDDDLRIAYTGSSWGYRGSRGYGDLNDNVHFTSQNGEAATITFTGTGISFLTETNSDEGDIGITLDGVSKGTVSANTAQRQVMQPLYSVTGLSAGQHTLTVTKLSGSYMLVDGFILR